MSILPRNTELEKLEASLDWYGAFRYCADAWSKDRGNLDALLRAMTEEWFLLTFWGQLDHIIDGVRTSDHRQANAIGPDYDLLINAIAECRQYGDEHFYQDPRCLCITGYLMNCQAQWFYGGYQECEEEGMRRLRAIPTEGNDACAIFGKILLEDMNVGDKTAEALFPGESEIDLYFRRMVAYRHGRREPVVLG